MGQKTFSVTVGPVTKDMTLEAIVAPVPPPATAVVTTVTKDHVSYSPSSPTVNIGDTVSIVMTADDGFEITGYILDGEETDITV